MPLDLLILGPFVFDAWSTPERMPFGGKHQKHVHKMPGGDRVIDRMGPDDEDRTFSAKFWGENAMAQALTLDQMRIAGLELPYSNGIEFRTVVIDDFRPKMVKFQLIEFDITLTPTDNPSTSGLGGLVSLGAQVVSDLGAAARLLP